MDKQLDEGFSDHCAIVACLGPLALMAAHAETHLRGAVLLMVSKDEHVVEVGTVAANAAKALHRTRVQLDELMQHLGDYFNANDSCTNTMKTITGPAYELLRMRKNGVSLDR
jgi:hypothetical protein